jgi:hypothetical protein
LRMLPVEILKERTREADRKKRDRAEDNEKRKRKRLEQQRELLEQGVLRCPRCARDRPGPGASARVFTAACRAHCRAHRCNADAVGPMKTPRVQVRIAAPMLKQPYGCKHCGFVCSDQAGLTKHERACRGIKRCHDKCLLSLQVTACTTQEGARIACKECGAYGMLHDIGRAHMGKCWERGYDPAYHRGRAW